MNNPQPIEPPKKKGTKPQVSFNLSAEENQLKEDFSRLVGNRGIKPVVMEFIRRFVEYNGKIATVKAGEDVSPSPMLVYPQAKAYKDEDQARLHRLLDVIWETGTPYTNAIKNNIEMLAFAVTVGKGFSPEDLRDILDTLLNKPPDEPNTESGRLPKVG